MVIHPSDVGEEPVRALKWQKSTILSFIQKSTHQTHCNTFDARLMHVSSMIFHFSLQSKYLQLTWSWVEASVNNVLYSVYNHALVVYYKDEAIHTNDIKSLIGCTIVNSYWAKILYIDYASLVCDIYELSRMANWWHVAEKLQERSEFMFSEQKREI